MKTDLDIRTSPPDALEKLDATLALYGNVAGKTAQNVLALKGGQLLMGNQDPRFGATFPGLHQLFVDETPREGAITAAAKARRFRVGRREFGGGLSPTALSRAAAMMDGNKSILISPSADGERFSFVRRGVRLTKRKRPRRVHYRPGRLSYAVAPDNVLRRSTDKVVNFRALAVWFELRLRESGRRFMGASWLYRRWRAYAKVGYIPEGTAGLAAGVGKSRQFGGTDWRLINNNPRSTLQTLGSAEMQADPAGNATLRITSNVPGVQSIGNARGIFSRAIYRLTLDTEVYLARKQQEAADALLRGSGAVKVT